MEAVTEKGGDSEVLTAEVQPETDREGIETEEGVKATAETGKDRETKAESEVGGVWTGIQEAERVVAETE